MKKVIRATDAKEVGVENPSEETFCRPDQKIGCRNKLPKISSSVNLRLTGLNLTHFSRDNSDFIRIFPRPDTVDPFV